MFPAVSAVQEDHLPVKKFIYIRSYPLGSVIVPCGPVHQLPVRVPKLLNSIEEEDDVESYTSNSDDDISSEAQAVKKQLQKSVG